MTAIERLAAAYVVSAATGTVIAVRDDERANLAGLELATDDVLKDFVVGAGTGLSPPLVMLVALGGATLATRGRHRRIALRVIAALGACFAAGQLGEPVTGRTLLAPRRRPRCTAVVLANVIIPASMCAVAVRELRR